MMLRPSTWLLTALLLGLGGVVGSLVHAGWAARTAVPQQAARAALVERLGLTDLCLFTEARYTRHPSQADRHAAFQDHPFALEHFPSGSVLPPPALLKGRP